MTYRGVHRDTQTCEPAKHHKKELPDGQFKDIKSLEVGVQIPRCIYTEVSKENPSPLFPRVTITDNCIAVVAFARLDPDCARKKVRLHQPRIPLWY